MPNECLKEVNGGVNWGKVGSGTWDALVGTGEMYGGLCGIGVPEPASTIIGVGALVDGAKRTYGGFKKAFTGLRE